MGNKINLISGDAREIYEVKEDGQVNFLAATMGPPTRNRNQELPTRYPNIDVWFDTVLKVYSKLLDKIQII